MDAKHAPVPGDPPAAADAPSVAVDAPPAAADAPPAAADEALLDPLIALLLHENPRPLLRAHRSRNHVPPLQDADATEEGVFLRDQAQRQAADAAEEGVFPRGQAPRQVANAAEEGVFLRLQAQRQVTHPAEEGVFLRRLQAPRQVANAAEEGDFLRHQAQRQAADAADDDVFLRRQAQRQAAHPAEEGVFLLHQAPLQVADPRLRDVLQGLHRHHLGPRLPAQPILHHDPAADRASRHAPHGKEDEFAVDLWAGGNKNREKGEDAAGSSRRNRSASDFVNVKNAELLGLYRSMEGIIRDVEQDPKQRVRLMKQFQGCKRNVLMIQQSIYKAGGVPEKLPKHLAKY